MALVTTHAARAQVKGIRRRSTTENVHQFHYKPLDRTAGAIRLIRVFPLGQKDTISCRIERHHASTVEYVALSYVWGSEEAFCSILMNGQVFKVTPNLLAFLRHLARTGYFTDTLFWVDAICINQRDTAEKNHHISHMGTIYRQAKKVIAWLGNSAYYSVSGTDPPGPWICCETFADERKTGKRHRCVWPVPSITSWDLLRHEYWCRLWVAQELELARQVDVLWRGRFYNWTRIKECLSGNITSVRERQSRSAPLSDVFVSNTTYLGSLPVARYLKATDSAPLRTLVPQFASHECRIGHDHAFALLSMASDGGKFEPDYDESPISLLLRLMTFFCADPTLAFMNKIGSALGLEPDGAGIKVDLVGHPRPDETIESSSTYYQLADSYQGKLGEEDMVVRLPDTNLAILFRRTSSLHENCSYSPLARVNIVSTRVEHGKRRFAGHRRKRINSAFTNVPLSQSQIWSTVSLKKEVGACNLRMICSWKAVLAIFELSQTNSTSGRLESRIREWAAPPNLEPEDLSKFVISREIVH